jgi:hypothetical protein
VIEVPDTDGTTAREDAMETQKIDVWDDENDNVGAEGHHDPATFIAAVREYHRNDCGFSDEEITRFGYDFTPERVEHIWLRPGDGDDDRMYLADAEDQRAVPHTLILGGG